jgi:MFS family permease
VNPEFFKVTSARFLFSLSVQSQAVLMGWQMYERTRDPWMLGLVGLCAALPALVLAPFSGWWVDRGNPLRIYQGVMLISLVSVMIAWSSESPFGLFSAAFLTGLVRSFSSPAMNSIIPRIISRSEIKRFSAYTALAFQLAGVVGPGLSGVLLGAGGYTFPYVFCVSALVVGSLTLWTLENRFHPVPDPGIDSRKWKDEILSGFRYVWAHPVLLSVMSLDMFAVLFGGVTAMLPVFAVEVLHTGPVGLGWLRAAPAMGAILMGAVLVRHPVSRGAGHKLLASIAGFGICIIVFGLSRSYPLSFLALLVSGALDSVSMVIRGAIVQLCSPEGLRGRIAAVNAVFIGSSNEIGEFESGLAAKLLGTVPSVLFGGCMTLITVAWVGWRSSGIRNLDLSRLEK